jgi:hypothetical protein
MMNERIKQLAEQAGFNPYNYQGGNSALFEKFAELIVRECAEVADMNAVEAMGLYGKVLEHFGVEV